MNAAKETAAVTRRPRRARGAASEPWDLDKVKPLENWMTSEEAAEYLRISRNAVWNLVRRRTLPKVRKVGSGPKPTLLIWAAHVRDLPVSPQRARQLRLMGEQDGAEADPELGDGLPEG